MSQFELNALKAEIKAKYPSIKVLPLHHRVLARLRGHKIEVAVSYEDGRGRFVQRAIVVEYHGKEYLLKFGRLFN